MTPGRHNFMSLADLGISDRKKPLVLYFMYYPHYESQVNTEYPIIGEMTQDNFICQI